ncbi:TPA: hypothetical protein QCN85_006048, partial [Bacillus anthracis]|nr:hypothetical protein [Bacillus anthracis]
TQDAKFDFGEVVVRLDNMSSFRQILASDLRLENTSLLEKKLPERLQDLQEFKDSILNETFSDEYNLTPSQLQILRDFNSQGVVFQILDLMFTDGNFKPLSKLDNQQITELFGNLYKF